MAKTALVSGITGQDGSFLAEVLLEKGYDVYGIIRRSSSFNTDRIDHLYQDPHEKGTRLRLIYGDLNDSSSLNTILRQVQPDEIYNLSAVAKLSFPARLLAPRPASRSVCRTSFIWAISTRAATGVMRATMSKRCG